MSERSFEMRLWCDYQGTDNEVADLRVEHLVEGEWQGFDLGTRSPGFQIFVYSVLTCQHLYFRTNSAERGLRLRNAQGAILMVTDSDWNLLRLQIRFHGRLQAGVATDEDRAFIAERMQLCPVSRNIREVADSLTEVDLT